MVEEGRREADYIFIPNALDAASAVGMPVAVQGVVRGRKVWPIAGSDPEDLPLGRRQRRQSTAGT